MSRSRIMGAGLAGATRKGDGANVNQVQFGNKLQGLPPTTGQDSNSLRAINNRAFGNQRNVVFCVNQLGGVGGIRGSNMFASTADGVGNCVPGPYEPNPGPGPVPEPGLGDTYEPEPEPEPGVGDTYEPEPEPEPEPGLGDTDTKYTYIRLDNYPHDSTGLDLVSSPTANDVISITRWFDGNDDYRPPSTFDSDPDLTNYTYIRLDEYPDNLTGLDLVSSPTANDVISITRWFDGNDDYRPPSSDDSEPEPEVRA